MLGLAAEGVLRPEGPGEDNFFSTLRCESSSCIFWLGDDMGFN